MMAPPAYAYLCLALVAASAWAASSELATQKPRLPLPNSLKALSSVAPLIVATKNVTLKPANSSSTSSRPVSKNVGDWKVTKILNKVRKAGARKLVQPPSWLRMMTTVSGNQTKFVGPAILLSPRVFLVSYYNHKVAIPNPHNQTAHATFSSIIQPTINPINLTAINPSLAGSRTAWPKLTAVMRHLGLVLFRAPKGFFNETGDQLQTTIPEYYSDEDCYALKFYPKTNKKSGDNSKSYVFVKVYITIFVDLCDGRFCYGKPVEDLNRPGRNDLKGIQNTGVPIFCNDRLSYINMPRVGMKNEEHQRLVTIQALADELRRYNYPVYKKLFTNPVEPIPYPS